MATYERQVLRAAVKIAPEQRYLVLEILGELAARFPAQPVTRSPCLRLVR